MGVEVTMQRTAICIEGYTKDVNEALGRMHNILREVQQQMRKWTLVEVLPKLVSLIG